MSLEPVINPIQLKRPLEIEADRDVKRARKEEENKITEISRVSLNQNLAQGEKLAGGIQFEKIKIKKIAAGLEPFLEMVVNEEEVTPTHLSQLIKSFTPLQFEIFAGELLCRTKKQDLIERLLEYGISIDTPNLRGETALYLAVLQLDVQFTSWLISKEAQPYFVVKVVQRTLNNWSLQLPPLLVTPKKVIKEKINMYENFLRNGLVSTKRKEENEKSIQILRIFESESTESTEELELSDSIRVFEELVEWSKMNVSAC